MSWVLLVIAGLLEVGAATVGIIAKGDPATPMRIGFLNLLVVAVVGLKATSGH